MTAPLSVCLRWSAPDHQRLWSGSSWFCLCFFRVLASDRHWALWVDSSKAVVPVLLFVALWFILRGIRFMSYLVLFCSCVFSVLLALRLPRFGTRELILVLSVRLFDLCLFGFVGFLFLLVSRKSCGLRFWHFLDFSITLL